MPLRDHFLPSANDTAAWEEVHAMWPAVVVQHLVRILPEGYVAVPRVHLGTEMEVDVGALERSTARHAGVSDHDSGPGGIATAVAAPPPTVEFETEWPDQDEFETRIYETSRGRRLVAAIEFVGPGNKDRPENRRAFVAKCAALLQHGVSVSIVDVVTVRQFNLCSELMEMIRQSDPVFSPNRPPIYVATCRARNHARVPKIAVWASPLMIGTTLPKLTIWLTEDLPISVDLEASYEESCRVLMIP